MKNHSCLNLETKKLYIPELQQHAFKEKDHSGYEGHFWCATTGAEFGPDDGVVNLKACSNCDRGCFEASE